MVDRRRLATRMVILLKLSAVAAVVLAICTAGTVQYTARSEFCSSCHIMEPYYESWQHSAHAGIDCVDCHYEPGLLETAEGKFKALSQLAKYITSTQGTKPWAEVSDQSCMRSGCHSERLISGEIEFGRIRFDHRHHLLETRRGRRLRCTSCHSHIVQGEHMKVTSSSCFLCHLRPSETQKGGQGDCNTCHGPPPEDIDVAGRVFRHSDYIDRGVDCSLCHRDVTRGDGLAKRSRCNACHSEVEHIERFGDTAFIHEHHITTHKVECHECHEDLEHGLASREHSADAGECGDCHAARHGPQWSVYAGQGGAGVEPMPSRMYQTRVDCSACHRDYFAGTADRGMTGVAPAGEVGCIHCHGAPYAGMLAGWRGEVEGALKPLQEALGRLESAGAPPSEVLSRARANLDLVTRDGSFGAHNIEYVLSLLRSVRDGINEQGPALSPSFEALKVDIGLAAEIDTSCGTCHVDAASQNVRFGGVPFRHRRHLVTAGFACGDCHSEGTFGHAEHGRTVMTPADCAECHHEPDSTPDCAGCHDHADRLLRGTLEIEGAELELDNVHAKLKCSDCHTNLEAENPLGVVKKACVECHNAGFADMVEEWREGMAEAVDEVAKRFTTVEERVRAATADRARVAGPLLEKARTCLDAARKGLPAHSVDGADSLLTAATGFLDRCEERLQR